MIIADWRLRLKITKCLSEDVNRRRTDNSMAKIKPKDKQIETMQGYPKHYTKN